MRFPSAMRLSLLVFFALSPPSALSTRATLVDVLSQHSQFSSLLHLLQRARLIPTLNRLSNATFFAPTNDAIEKWNTEHPEPTDPDDGNINESLRQHLFYHLLNYTLDDIAPQLPVPLETLLFPEVPLELPSPSPPPSPPWLPVPGGLLNSEGQRLRIVLRAGESFVGVDAFGRGGSQIIKRHLTASNGLVLPIDEVIPAPTDLATTIANHPILSTFNSFLTKELKNTLSTAPHLTLFFPLDSAWDALDPIERLYLDSGFAEKDIERLVAFHSVNDAGIDGHGSVGWTESWTDGQKLTTPEGNELRIGFSPDGSIQINEATVVQPDIYASNGVLHLVTDLLFPEGSFKLNVEKSLLALNCTQFVSLLRSADLSHYVDDDHDGQPWTILAPRDDVFSFFTESESETETQLSIETKPPIFPDLKRSLKYHILPGIVNPKDLQDGMLIGTELREVGLGGGRQQLIVSVGGKGGTITHGKHGNGEIGFGGGMVIGEPVRVSDSIIYLISKVLEPPPEALLTIMPNSKLSTFLASVLTSGLEKTINGEPSTTILVPPNSAFDELGLVATHLLLGEDDSKRDLVRVVKHHIIKGVVYRTGLGGNETSFEPTEGDGGTYGTLEGSDVRLADGTVTASGGWGNAATIDTTSLDTLTQTGVVHTLTSGVLIPRSVRIGLNELVRAAKGGTMRSLIVRAGFEGVFDGTLKLEEVEGWRPVDLEDRWDWNWDWPWNKKGKKGIDYKNVNWTILVPTDDAFKSVNLTRLLSDPVALRRLVMQHLIPIFPGSPAPPPDQPARPIPFQDSATFSTLLSPSSLHGDIALRQTTKGSFLLGIQGARSHSATNPSEGKNDFATITSYGRTTTGKSKVASGVIQLDRVLDPWIPGWWVAWGQAVTFGVLGVLGVCVFWGLVGWVWWKEESEATFEPLYGEDD